MNISMPESAFRLIMEADRNPNRLITRPDCDKAIIRLRESFFSENDIALVFDLLHANPTIHLEEAIDKITELRGPHIKARRSWEELKIDFFRAFHLA